MEAPPIYTSPNVNISIIRAGTFGRPISSTWGFIVYHDIDRLYAGMRRGRGLPTAGLEGCRLPFVRRPLFPGNKIRQGLLRSGDGPCAIASVSIPGALRFCARRVPHREALRGSTWLLLTGLVLALRGAQRRL